MQPAEAIETFKVLAAEVVAELEVAVAERDESYPNADVALQIRKFGVRSQKYSPHGAD
jgi:hypothetical protein